ncbi:MAG TPA: glycosyltransferase [Clostridia bacterium]|nr:glycosyltransferase [Clostridia bacterium]
MMNDNNIDVLMLTASYGGGHLQAAKAMVLGLKALKPDLRIETLDYVRWLNSALDYITRLLYVKVTSKAPLIWHILYDITDRPFFAKYSIARKLGFGRLYNYIAVKKPKVIISTHFFTTAVIGEMKNKGLINIPLATIITDNIMHALWFNPNVDLYLVANEMIKKELIKKGISPDDVKVTGIPIDLKFNHKESKNSLRRRYNLSTELPTILVMCGAYGMGDILGICDYLAKHEKRLQVVVVTGKDEKLKKRISELAFGSRNKFLVLGYVNNVFEWMGVSDLLISKAGGLTTSEALASNLPMLIYRPIPGQEEGNANYLMQAGVARVAYNMEQFKEDFQYLLSQPNLLAEMSSKCSLIKKPLAALQGSKMLLDIMEIN